MIVIWLAGLLASTFALWRAGRRLRFCLHVAQLEGYKAGPYAAWMAARPFDVVFRISHGLGLVVLAGLWWGPWPGRTAAAVGLFSWAVAFASSRRYRRDRPKKPIASTPRLIRLATTAAVLAALPVLAGLWMVLSGGPWTAIPTPFGGMTDVGGTVVPVWQATHPAAAWLAGLFVADLMAPIWVALAIFLNAPLERLFHARFKSMARARLAARPDLIVVAITGSYGKTSVKFAVAEMLGQRYNVLATPGSFNTPMGICKVINEQLKPEHQVLVLEMGIRHPGDIAELCEIARPHVAVITSIGVAHLESMGSMDAIAREKGSLLDFLLPGGTTVLNADDDRFAELKARAPGAVLSVSASGRASADFRATDVSFSPDGTRFTVHAAAGGSEPLVTPLLGRHHVVNTLLGIAVAHALDIRLRPAAKAAERLRPVPHRLSLRSEHGVSILDDAFNSNPVGAAGALEVLGQFKGRRFVITPGMVELGAREAELNHEFGRQMASNADEVWLVGPSRTRPIAEGLLAAGFSPEHLHVVTTLFEARDSVRRAANPGDVVLYENDLPDQYTEAV